MPFGLITNMHAVFDRKLLGQHEFNYELIDEYLNDIKNYRKKHGTTQKNAHDANQITYGTGSIAEFYNYLVGRMNNLVVGHNGDGIIEVTDARVDNSGFAHPTLHERLKKDYEKYMLNSIEIKKEIKANHDEFIASEYRFDPQNQEMQFITDLAPRTNAVMQSFWIDSKTSLIYMTQARPGGDYMLTRLNPNGQYIDRTLVKKGGHGTHNAYRYINGTLWIYSYMSDGYGRAKLVKFKYKKGEIVYGRDTEDVYTGYKNRYITAVYNPIEDVFIFRIENTVEEFKKTNILNYIEVRKAADIDNNVMNVIHKLDIPYKYTNNIQPMQGVSYDDGILFWYTGDSIPSNPNYLIAFDIETGEELWRRQVTIGGYDNQYIGKFQEAEGLSMYYDEETGKKALLIGVTTGPGNNRHHEIYSVAQRDLNDILRNRAFPVLMTDSGGRTKPLPAQGFAKLSSVTEIGHYYLYTSDTIYIKDFPVDKAWRSYGWFFDVLPGDINGTVRQVLTRASFGRNTMIFSRNVDIFTGKTSVGWSYIKSYGEMWETPPKTINRLADLNIPGLEIYLTAEDTKRFVDFPSQYKGIAGFVYLRVKLSENQYKEYLYRNNIVAPPETLQRTTQGSNKSKWFTNAGSYKEVK